MKITVLGSAGVVGSCTAFALASQGIADELVLLDQNRNMLLNHALDMEVSLLGFNKTAIKAGNDEDMTDSDIVIISAGIHFPAMSPVEEKLKANVPIMKELSEKITRYCPKAVVIVATNPVDLLSYAVYVNAGIDRKKILGYNLNDTTRFRMMTAKALNVAFDQVEGMVIGEHPAAQLMLFSSLKMDGNPVEITENLKQSVQTELRGYLSNFEALKINRTAGWTSAMGILQMVMAITNDSGKLFSCSTVVDGEYGYKNFCMGVPAIIGREGIREIQEWTLAQDEQQQLTDIAVSLEKNAGIVRELSGR